MNEPLRLRDGDGAARRLMAGAVMHVPSGSRQRAVAFTSAAATIGASTVAVAASSASVIKTFVLCVALGAAGGGVASLAASETFARLETKSAAPAPPGPLPAVVPAAPVNLPAATEAVATATPPEGRAPQIPEPVAKESSGKRQSLGRDEGVEPRVAVPSPARQPRGASLFEEQRIIESARAAVARGDARTAFSLLDGYEQAFPIKQFWPEALALRIEALRSSGQLDAARARAADFAQKYPHHPLLPRVQSSVGR